VRGLALSRPTVIADLPHQSHVPALDPPFWAGPLSTGLSVPRPRSPQSPGW
jgi:hypothetical protein